MSYAKVNQTIEYVADRVYVLESRLSKLVIIIVSKLQFLYYWPIENRSFYKRETLNRSLREY